MDFSSVPTETIGTAFSILPSMYPWMSVFVGVAAIAFLIRVVRGGL